MSDQHEPPILRGDRVFTFRVTFVSLFVGVMGAVLVSFILLSLRQPLTSNAKGEVTWSIGAFMIPAAGLITTLILGWSVFFLPVSLARRQGVVLDPQVWPVTGAIAVGVLLIVAFVGAIIFGVI
jgi:hypothetical protein